MSLPRLKTLHETENRNNSSKDLKVKFRKIALDQTDKDSRKKSITVLRTERLKTFERFSTLEQKREYKNQKINLNLIERKLMSGTYDEKNQTSSQLTAIKQRRDQMKVEIALKQKQIQKFKLLIEDVRQSIRQSQKIKEKNESKLIQLEEQHENQKVKTESAREYKMVLQNITKRNQQTNSILSKRNNNLSEQAQHLKSLWSSASISQRETSQKCSANQNKLHTIIEQSNKNRGERNEEVMKYQYKINKRIDGEIMHLQKSRQYVARLDHLDYMTIQREFHLIYDKILANYFIGRLAKLKMINLMSQYTAVQKLYSEIASYKTFDASSPAELVTRFLDHQPQKAKWQEQIKQKQDFLNSIETKSSILKKNYQIVKIQLDQIESESTSMKSSQILLKEKIYKKELKKECLDIEQKIVRIKSYIYKMLGKMNQKGQKNINNGNLTTFNNLNLLTNSMKETFKQLA